MLYKRQVLNFPVFDTPFDFDDSGLLPVCVYVVVFITFTVKFSSPFHT